MTWRRAGIAAKQVALLWAGVVVCTVALRPVLMRVPVLLPGCTLHTWTGIPCPTCGATRAMMALLDGHPLAALVLNPMAAAGGLVFLVGGVMAPVWTLCGGAVPVLPHPVPMPWRVAMVAAVLANWGYLVLTGI